MVVRDKTDENFDFARFLKSHADEELLDKQFKMLHNKYFKNFDCASCRNCCKAFKVNFSKEEIEKGAKALNCSVNDFIDKYLEVSDTGNYRTKTKPCPFLKEEHCLIEQCKPRECWEYPYTNKPDRVSSLYNIASNAEVCPVVDKIFDELKEIYNFKYYR